MISDWIISLLRTLAVAVGQLSSNLPRCLATWVASACISSTICCCDSQPQTSTVNAIALNKRAVFRKRVPLLSDYGEHDLRSKCWWASVVFFLQPGRCPVLYCLILLIFAPPRDASPIRPFSPKTNTFTGLLRDCVSYFPPAPFFITATEVSAPTDQSPPLTNLSRAC